MARVIAASVVAYALSPIDLIPDFSPVLGYLDDEILVPLGMLLAVKLVPCNVVAEHWAEEYRRQADPAVRSGAIAVVMIWLIVSLLCAWWLAAAYRYIWSSIQSLSIRGLFRLGAE